MAKKAWKYAMGIDIRTTKRHPPYSHTKSAEANYKEGLKYAHEHGLDKLWVARSLEQLANLTHKEVFKEAAHKAFVAYDRERERG